MRYHARRSPPATLRTLLALRPLLYALPHHAVTDAPPITVWLVEDEPFYRHAFRDLVDDAADIRLGRAFGTCEEALEALDEDDAPDVVVLDIGLPGMPGTEGARRVKARSPASQVIMLTVHEDDETIFEALCAGASGYLLKNAASDRILQALREVYHGGVPFTPPVARRVLQRLTQTLVPPADYGLTAREKEILRHMADGATQKRMAADLFLSPHTIDTHLRNIYAKLHVHSGMEAVAKALRERLIG